MKIEQIHHAHDLARKYADLIQTEWRQDFLRDFPEWNFSSRKDIDDFQIYIAYKEDVVLWWALISKNPLLNPYSDPSKTLRKQELCKKWYRLLTYMIVCPEQKWKGIGTKILKEALNKNAKTWITCNAELHEFYKNSWFTVDIPKSETSSTTLMTYQET